MKFSIRQMLYGMIVAAFIAAMIGAGANGSPLAYGLGISICMFVVYFAIFAALYWSTLLISGGRKQLPSVPVDNEQKDAAS